MVLLEESGMWADALLQHKKTKALANKEMTAIKRAGADEKTGPAIWVDPQRPACTPAYNKAGGYQREGLGGSRAVDFTGRSRGPGRGRKSKARPSAPAIRGENIQKEEWQESPQDKDSPIRRPAKKAAAALTAGLALYVVGQALQL